MRSQFAELLAEAGFLGSLTGTPRCTCVLCDALTNVAAGRRQSPIDLADDVGLGWNANALNAQVIRDGVLCAGLYPQVALGSDADGRDAWAVGNSKVAIHPSSVNHEVQNLARSSPFLLFHEKMLTTQVYIRECSAVSPAVRGGCARKHWQPAGADVCSYPRRACCCLAALWRCSTRKGRRPWMARSSCALMRRQLC
jgi:hypothetical protein